MWMGHLERLWSLSMNIKFYGKFETSLRNCGTIRYGGAGDESNLNARECMNKKLGSLVSVDISLHYFTHYRPILQASYLMLLPPFVPNHRAAYNRPGLHCRLLITRLSSLHT